MAPPKKTPPKKSADAKLQDAQAAREAERVAPAASIEQLPALLQGAADDKAAAGASEESIQLTKKNFDSLMDNLTTLTKRIQSLEASPGSAKVAAAEALPAYIKCPRCGQATRICKGDNHKLIRVAPHDRDLWKDFPGVTWNGAKYAGLSWVPEAIVNDVLSAVNIWENTEKQKYTKGGRVFGEHEMRGLTQQAII